MHISQAAIDAIKFAPTHFAIYVPADYVVEAVRLLDLLGVKNHFTTRAEGEAVLADLRHYTVLAAAEVKEQQDR